MTRNHHTRSTAQQNVLIDLIYFELKEKMNKWWTQKVKTSIMLTCHWRWIYHFSISLTLVILQRQKKKLPDIGGTIHDVGCHLAVMQAGVHTMSDELILQISCNIFLAFKWILMMTSGQNISHYATAELSVHVWNHDLIWWQNRQSN